MKRFKIFLFSLFIAAGLSGCAKNEEVIVSKSVVEFDAATWNSNAAGKTYPIVTRVPGYGRAISSSADPTITKSSGTIMLRVNLVGPQRNSDTQITYAVEPGSTTAVEGVHYAALAGTATIPANSSFGEIAVQILDLGTSPPATVDLILQITGADSGITPSENYKTIGLRIAQ